MSALHELPEFDWEEIKKHNDKSSLWIVVHDCVYDVTSFQEEVCKKVILYNVKLIFFMQPASWR